MELPLCRKGCRTPDCCGEHVAVGQRHTTPLPPRAKGGRGRSIRSGNSCADHSYYFASRVAAMAVTLSAASVVTVTMSPFFRSASLASFLLRVIFVLAKTV